MQQYRLLPLLASAYVMRWAGLWMDEAYAQLTAGAVSVSFRSVSFRSLPFRSVPFRSVPFPTSLLARSTNAHTPPTDHI